MSDKQIGEYPLNIKIVSGSYEIANIDINVKVPDEFKDKMRKVLVDAVMSLEESLKEN